MAGIRINFAEVEGGFEPVPEGTYEVMVEEVEVRESRSSDNNYLNWRFRILDEEYEGRFLWNITSLSERALFRLKEVFLALDVIAEDDEISIDWEDDVDITTSSGPRLVEPEVEGLACALVVRIEPYEGKDRNRVTAILPAGEGSGDPATVPAGGGDRPRRSAAARRGARRKLR